jgi:PAS domain S-box-containing protein
VSAASPRLDVEGAEISALIETLSAAEERLEVLTGGQVDAVVTRSGRTFMLQRSQELLRRHEAIRQAAILDALPACVALLDGSGAIASVNEAWRRFARKNGMIAPEHGVGRNYFEICAQSTGEDAALRIAVAAGVRAVLRGELPSYSVEYACHSPDAERWFLLMASPLVGRPHSGAVLTHFDVTERTRAQRDTLRSSQLLAAVIDGTPDHVFAKDLEGRYLLCNRSLASLVGRPVEEMIGRTNAELRLVERALLTSQAALARAEVDRQVLATGSAVSSEDQFTTRSGVRTFLATKAPYRNELGEVVGVIGISRDITDRKAAEQTLRESQAQLSMASRLALVGSWYFEPPGDKMFWSDALALMHDEPPGFAPTVAQAIAYSVSEHRAGITQAVEACVASGTPFDLEFQIQTARGKRIWGRAIGESVRSSDGAIVRVQGALQDVSARKRAEHQTRLLADRLTNILGSITDGFLTLDRAWSFTFVNAEALRMLGRPSDNLVGSNIWQELPQLLGTALQAGLRRAMQATTGSSFEAFYAPWNGWIGVNCYPSKTGLSIYFSDVTQRRKDQDALRELNADLEARVAARTAELTQLREDAEQANRAKSAFLAAMSHEIRTPMNGVVGMIDVLEQSNLKSAQAKIVQTVRASAYALLGIVDDVLDFSKIEAGRFQIDREPMCLATVVGEAHDTLDHLASSRNVVLRLAIDPHFPAFVLGDALRLRQVLLNLVGNAIKFSSVGGEAGRVGLRATLVERGARRCSVEFVVEDDGIGMDEGTLGRLFTPFMQADDSTTKRFGGTGLGLSISHRLADLMGGTIRVASRPGEGSCFTLCLSFEVIDEIGPGAAPAGPALDFRDSGLDAVPAGEATMPMPLSALGASEAGRLILVAEDNEINQEVIRQQLALMGFTADIAGNGLLALERWRQGAHAMLLTDLHMPGLDGYQLAAQIRAAEAPGTHLPIVALTANASKAETQRCKDIGIDRYMTKPLQLGDLHAMLKAWMPAGAQPLPLRAIKSYRTAPPSRAAGMASGATEIPAIDLSVLSALVGSDPEVIRDMLVSFRMSAGRSRDAIRIGIAAGAGKDVADAAHPLKSAARSIGATRLAAVCAELEAAGEAGRLPELVARLATFEQAYADVDRSLADA